MPEPLAQHFEFMARRREECLPREPHPRDNRIPRPREQLQRTHGLLAGDRGEGPEKVVQAVAAFEMVQEVPHRDASPNEDRRAAEDLRVAVDDSRSAGPLDG